MAIIQGILVILFSAWMVLDQQGLVLTTWFPIMAALFVGLIMGDMKTAMVIGGTFQLMALGVANIGGSSVPNWGLASLVGIYVAIRTTHNIADAKAVGYVSTLFGRRRALPELASSNFNVRSSGERMARNTPIQGTAADVIKLAMVRVWKRLRDEKMESRLILTVHDELIVEAPQAEAEKAAQILREEMEGCVQYAVPLSTDVHAGKNWLEAH